MTGTSLWRAPADYHRPLNYGSCIRLRPERLNHVWAYDFVAEKTHDGRTLKLLCVIDEYTHECLAIRVARRMTPTTCSGCWPTCSWSTASPSTSVQTTDPSSSLPQSGTGSPISASRRCSSNPAHPRENGYVESFNSKLRDELLNGEIFSTLREAQILTASTACGRTAPVDAARRLPRRSFTRASNWSTSHHQRQRRWLLH